MKNELLTVAEAAERINSGAVVVVAGVTELMEQLPKGKWIGGTSSYFVTEGGGAVVKDKLFCTTFDEATDASVRLVGAGELNEIASGYKAGGFSVILIPAFSDMHTKFALEGANHAELFDQPLVGWITGVHLDDIATAKAAVFDGATGERYEDGAALLHVALPEGASVDVDIVNIFTQDEAPTFVFSESGFSAKTCKVNGEEVNLAQYLTDNEIDTRLPLVANYAGSMINVSVQAVDAENGEVQFYAPVQAGMEYKLAAPQPDYAAAFANSVGTSGAGLYSCNCILNYLYGELEGKQTGNFTGPVTFGEVAYILLNQTLVKLDIQNA